MMKIIMSLINRACNRPSNILTVSHGTTKLTLQQSCKEHHIIIPFD